jgi:putative colanic acid biosynthesis acetyltransferase WcaF
LTIGEEASIAHGVDCYCVDRLTIGAHATVSQYAFLCTASHDPCDPHMRLVTAPITIESQSWICAGAYLLPGVRVGTGAVVGARAVVTRDVAAWQIVAGNPARTIGRRELSVSGQARSTEVAAPTTKDSRM